MAQLSERLHTIRCLSARELKVSLLSPGLYVPVTVGFIVASAVIRNYLKSIEGNGMLILANPLNQPLYWCIIVASVYLALSSTISMAREKESGTLEMLFHGPVDMPSFVIGKFVEHIGTYLVFAVLFVAFFIATSFLTNFGFDISFAKVLLSSIFLASCTVSFGTLISAITAKVKNAALVFSGLVVIFLAVQFMGSVLVNIQPDNYSSFAAYLKLIVDGITSLFSWISPFSYLTRGISAIDTGNTGAFFISLGQSLVYVVVTLYLSILAFRKKGVKRA
jgi:ABC-type transport system involved in multi-copper enzyme maturation permease subunit